MFYIQVLIANKGDVVSFRRELDVGLKGLGIQQLFRAWLAEFVVEHIAAHWEQQSGAVG